MRSVVPQRLRRASSAVAVLTGLALALTLAPRAVADVPPSSALRTSAYADSPARSHPTKSQRKQGKVARRVLETRPGDRGRVLDFRRALKAAGRSHKVIAQDVALGMMKRGGKVTHISKAQRKTLAKRAKKLGQRVLSKKLTRSSALASTPCLGVNRIDLYWWGYRGLMDSCRTESVQEGLETVAFVTGLLAVLYPLDARNKAIVAIAVAVVGVGIFVLSRCNKAKRGVHIYHATSVGVGDIWCLSQ